MENLTIGQLAKKANVNVQTVRYYERRGLLPEPDRRISGYREYTPDFVKRLRFIKRAQDLGFTLKEISELLSLRVDPETTCQDVRKHAQAKLLNLDEKIRDLERMKKALEKLASACRGRGPTSDCPIVEFLETAEEG